MHILHDMFIIAVKIKIQHKYTIDNLKCNVRTEIYSPT